MRELPHENELQAVKKQKSWMYLEYGCITLMGGSLYLEGWFLALIPIAFCLLCVTILARAILVFQDGFFARGGLTKNEVVRGSYGIVLAIGRLIGELVIGIFILLAWD